MRTREEIIEERRRLLRGNRFLKNDVHAGADRMLAHAAVYVQEALSRYTTTFLTGEVPNRGTQAGGELLDLAACWAFTRPEFAAVIHSAIEAAPVPDLDHSWSSLTRAELDQKVQALEDELAEAEENRRAPLLAERDRVDEELAALELAATAAERP